MKEESAGVSEAPSGGSNIFPWAVAIILIAAGGVFFLVKDRWATEKDEVNEEMVQVRSGENDEDVKVLDLSAKLFEFSPKEIRVKKGDTVRINLTVTQGVHDWMVDEFNVRTKQLKTGESHSIEFVADKAGTFEFYCSVLNHRQMGMVGKLIVE